MNVQESNLPRPIYGVVLPLHYTFTGGFRIRGFSAVPTSVSLFHPQGYTLLKTRAIVSVPLIIFIEPEGGTLQFLLFNVAVHLYVLL